MGAQVLRAMRLLERSRLTPLLRSSTAPLGTIQTGFLAPRFWPMRVPGFRPPLDVYRK